MTRRRREGRRRRRSRLHVFLGLAIVIVIVGVVGWKWVKLANGVPKGDPEKAKKDRAALVAAVNAALTNTGKGQPAANVVVNSAVFHNRDGKQYVAGTVQNLGKTVYPSLRLTFDTFDGRHNRSGQIEAEVAHLAPGEEAPFETAATNPQARTLALVAIDLGK